jgi:hypothetical protein
VPEILAAPYPIGSDPMQFYTPSMLRGLPSADLSLRRTFLYWLLQDLLFRYALHDPFLVVKLLGPLIHAILASALYIYAVKVMRWNVTKSFFVSILATTYFIALAISWTWFRMMLGTALMLFALTTLEWERRKASVLGALLPASLTAIAHEVPSFFLVLLTLCEAFRSAFRKDLLRSARFMAVAGVTGLLFLYQLYDPTLQRFYFPLSPSSAPSWGLLWTILSFAFYAYLPLIPLVIWGAMKLRAPELRDWILLTVLLAAWVILLSPGNEGFAIRLLMFSVYPLAFLFAHGLHRWVSANSILTGIGTIPIRKIVATILVLLLVMLSYEYATSLPENAFPYFSKYNPFLNYVPSSMLQTSISITDMPSAMNVAGWLSQHLDEHTMIVAHEAFWGVVAVTLPESSITRVAYAGNSSALARLVNASQNATRCGYSHVYTIWWIPGEGWWGITSLPNEFIMTYRNARIAAYLYSP